MIDEALRKFGERTHAMDRRFEKRSIELKAATEKSIADLKVTQTELKTANEKAVADLRTEMAKLNNRTITVIVGILSSLMVLMGAIGHWLSH